MLKSDFILSLVKGVPCTLFFVHFYYILLLKRRYGDVLIIQRQFIRFKGAAWASDYSKLHQCIDPKTGKKLKALIIERSFFIYINAAMSCVYSFIKVQAPCSRSLFSIVAQFYIKWLNMQFKIYEFQSKWWVEIILNVTINTKEYLCRSWGRLAATKVESSGKD